MWKRAALIVFGAAMLAAAACAEEEGGGALSAGSGQGDVARGTVPGTTVMGMGPGISIGEAMASTLDGPLLINGFLVAQGEGVRFCEALAESHPPQCADPSLSVEGLDLETLDGLESEASVTWSPQPVQLLGEVEGDTLQVLGTATG